MPKCNYCGSEYLEAAKWCSFCGKFISLPSGKILDGRFEITRKIANGGMGIIYLASDNQFPKSPRIIKEMTIGKQMFEISQKIITSFTDEAQLLSHLKHLGIPQVLAYFVENDRYYLVMEYIEGKNLERSIEKKDFNETQIISIISEICQILEYLHSQEPTIVHQDIKPGNIIIDPSGSLHLVDFGVFKLVKLNGSTKYLTRHTSIFGTYGFNAPETQHGKVLPQSDIYSLGMTAVWLLTGDTDREKFLEEKPCSKWLYSIIKRCIELEYKDRFQTAQNLQTALENKSESSPVIQNPIIQVVTPTPQILPKVNLSNLSSTITHCLKRIVFNRRDSVLVANLLEFVKSDTEQYAKFSVDQLNTIARFLLLSVNWEQYNQDESETRFANLIGRLTTPRQDTVADMLIQIKSSNVKKNFLSFLKENKNKGQYNQPTIVFALKRIYVSKSETDIIRFLSFQLIEWNLEQLIKQFPEIESDPYISSMFIQEIHLYLTTNTHYLNHYQHIVSINDIYQYLGFIRLLYNSGNKKLMDVSITRQIVDLDKIVNFYIYSCGVIYKREKIIKYCELLIDMLGARNTLGDLLALIIDQRNNLITILEIIRGWDLFTMICGSLIIFPTLIHTLGYKVKYNKRFKKIKKSFILLLIEYQTQPEVAHLIEKIKKI